MAGASMKKREGPKAPPTPDYQEERALARAVSAMQKFQPGANAALASVAIAEWIVARTAMAASNRLSSELLFDLKDSRMRGFLEAALPAIGGTLAHIPADKPLFELDVSQVVDVFMAGINGAIEAAVSANESLGFPFDDEVPY
jgi:hypothetical protein